MLSFINLMGNTITSDAAAAGTQGAAGGMSSIIMLVVMLAVFYFLLIRPQRKRDKEAKQMMASLKRGDKIVTIGGIRGTIATVRDNTVVVKVDDNAKIEFNKSAISSVLSRDESASEEKTAEVVEAPAKNASKKPAKAEPKKEVKAEEAKEEKKEN